MECWCECHRSEQSVTSSTCSGCYIDVELSSLGRLENITGVLVRMLHEESDSLLSRRVTFQLALQPRQRRNLSVGDSSRNISDNHQHPLQLSHLTIVDTTRDHVRKYITTTVKSSSDEDDDTTDSSSMDTVISSDGGCGESSKTSDDIEKRIRLIHTFLLYTVGTNDRDLRIEIKGVLRKTTTSDTGSPVLWFVDRVLRLANTLHKYRTSSNEAERQHLEILRKMFIQPLACEQTFTDHHHQEHDWVRLHTTLFFQWFRLMSVLPVEYDMENMNFMLLPNRNIIRIFACEYAYYKTLWDRANI